MNTDNKINLHNISTIAGNINEYIDSEFATDIFDLEKINLGMTELQINYFVLNRKEFTNDFALFKQAKFELYSRIQVLTDLYYEYKTTLAKDKLYIGEYKEASVTNYANNDIKEGKLELILIKTERNNIKTINIRKQIQDKLKEANSFYKVYKKYKYIEELSEEEIKKLEEESWKIKTCYYPELTARYNFTPSGYIPYEHETNKNFLIQFESALLHKQKSENCIKQKEIQ